MTRATERPSTREITCRVVAGADELAEHHRIRHSVFVGEQGVFPESDVDAVDARPDVLHVLAFADDAAVGTVRLYPLGSSDEAGLWQGDRLAVLSDRRSAGAGGPLVRFAVATAGALGGSRMLAHVQVPNRRFFERLGWTAVGTETYAGLPHVAMTIELPGSVRGSVQDG
ncbi:MSMEG_0567/Sll0786 family nitrogen starvation N-acetyltransferase [Pseudonocardia endophytica]|uniref:Putative N-acetyltransferase (TIGR04045 family) n=1 Tax=Pseudonocardia endophytica TaxID=401976 RepID=A0A4R1HT07_PSEEN|nr:MSMEG_0567/Sll0786 family nitrogen starvation N-acetyltransferase [Pseudonocardia endophytica]TCK24423.1 putative N-acetyltransferase (TIGR04045 family) [Pseudonocardia endophytica]